MEKIYAGLQRKINNLTTQEPNHFYDRKNALHKEYITQLDKTMNSYPAYKAETPNDYMKQLSLLNGITKKITRVQSELTGKINLFERNVSMGDVDIKKLKTVEENLQKYTSFDNLDATSKKMLADSISQYNRQRLLFWIKLGIISLIVVDAIKTRDTKNMLIVCGATTILSIGYIYYKTSTSKG
jgi:hypothetical protein